MILTVTANPAIDKAYFVDTFSMGQVHRPLRMSATAGGKGLNVSRVATLLGQQVTATGFIGGSSGAFLQEETEKAGIKAAFTPVAGQTRTCINIADSNGVSGEILEPGPEISAEEAQAFFHNLDTLLGSCSIVCVSGSLPRGLDASFYQELLRRAASRQKPVIMDTGSTMADIISEKPFMVKPNRDELAQFTGFPILSREDVEKGLLLLHEAGVAVPLVTLDKDGACCYYNGEFYHFTSPRLQVVSAVGSGDSTVAGIATGLCRGMSLPDAVRLGMAAGAANTQFPQTGMVSAALVQQFYAQIRRY